MLENNKNAVTVIYSGGDIQVPFLFFDAADLVVFYEITQKTLGADYTVTGAGNEAGGKVTLIIPPADGTRVTVIRKVDFTQLLQVPTNGIIPEGALNRALDRIVMMIQQLAEQAERAVTYPEGTEKDEVANAQEMLDSIEKARTDINNAVNVAGTTLDTANQKLSEINTVSTANLQEMEGLRQAVSDLADSADQVVNDAVAASGLSNPNILINGCFDVWQTGVEFSSATITNKRIADMFLIGNQVNAAFTVSRQQMRDHHTDLKLLLGFAPRYGAGINAAGEAMLDQRIETKSLAQAGDTLTFSFASTQTVHQWRWFGYDSLAGQEVGVLDGNCTVIGTAGIWNLHEAVIDISGYDYRSLTGVADYINVGIKGINEVGDVLITAVKLENGANRTPYPSESLYDCLRKCQRYYQTHPMLYLYTVTGSILARRYTAPRLVTMRTAPVESFTPSSGETISVGQQSTANLISLEATATSTGASVVAWSYAADARL